MKHTSRLSSIKKAQKESVIFRVISALVHEATLEMPSLAGLFVNRVELSPGKSVVNVFLYSPQGKEHFTKVLHDLTLFKPSMRKALASELNARYTAEIVFRFDEQLDKTMHIEQLLTKVSTENASFKQEQPDDEDDEEDEEEENA